VAEVNRLPDTVQSPCVRNCCLDDSDVCIGCHRAIAEITGWSAADNHQRNEILARCRQRREQRNAGKSRGGQ
jgi:predicted Fe-S protein YdhL (DUF1289 family)